MKDKITDSINRIKHKDDFIREVEALSEGASAILVYNNPQAETKRNKWLIYGNPTWAECFGMLAYAEKGLEDQFNK